MVVVGKCGCHAQRRSEWRPSGINDTVREGHLSEGEVVGGGGKGIHDFSVVDTDATDANETSLWLVHIDSSTTIIIVVMMNSVFVRRAIRLGRDTVVVVVVGPCRRGA